MSLLVIHINSLWQNIGSVWQTQILITKTYSDEDLIMHSLFELSTFIVRQH
jgi:hypothetical protein